MNQTAGYLTLTIVMGKCGTLALLGEYDGLIFAAAATMRPHTLPLLCNLFCYGATRNQKRS